MVSHSIGVKSFGDKCSSRLEVGRTNRQNPETQRIGRIK